jgi:hypothetical protein
MDRYPIIGLDQEGIDDNKGKGGIINGLKPTKRAFFCMAYYGVPDLSGKTKHAARHCNNPFFLDVYLSETRCFYLQDTLSKVSDFLP